MFVHVSECIHVNVIKKKGKLLEKIYFNIKKSLKWITDMTLYVNFMWIPQWDRKHILNM